MVLFASLAALFAAATAAAAPNELSGTATFERPLSQCAAFYDPKSPPSADTEPFRGEDMFVAINRPGGASRNAITGFPPSVDATKQPDGYRVTAKGDIEVGPGGDVIRVQVTSPEDGRFAAFAVAEIAFWRYKPVATSKLCRKIPVTVEWKAGK